MKFLEGNRKYETDGSPNLREQKEWMKNMSCVKLELDGIHSLENNAEIIVKNWEKRDNLRLKKLKIGIDRKCDKKAKTVYWEKRLRKE